MKLSYDPQPGMLVRCVDDEFDVGARGIVPNLPERGIVYTVRGVTVDSMAITLVEIENPLIPHTTMGVNHEPCFLSWRFVPVDPKALDVFREQRADA